MVTPVSPESPTGHSAHQPEVPSSEEHPPDLPQSDSPSDDDSPGRLRSLIDKVTGFIVPAGREWLRFLLTQPDPPFQHNAQFKFDTEMYPAVRLVVSVIVLTVIALGGASLFADKMAAIRIAQWVMSVLIGAVLTAIMYGIFAFLCGVRVYEVDPRRKLTMAQILFPILYVFVPWIPIYAFLWRAGSSGGTSRLLLLVLFFWICSGYMALGFVTAIRRVTHCPKYFVWLSVLFPVTLIVYYLLR